jgi:hypothetical protein
MNLKAFQGRYAGLVSLGKTVGILLLVINLAAAFVLERYRIARTAIEVGKLEDEIEQLHKNRAYLESKILNLESLDHVGSIASEKFSLKLPHPEQIVWLSDADLPRIRNSVIRRTIERLDFLYANLNVPGLGVTSAIAEEGAAK